MIKNHLVLPDSNELRSILRVVLLSVLFNLLIYRSISSKYMNYCVLLFQIDHTVSKNSFDIIKYIENCFPYFLYLHHFSLKVYQPHCYLDLIVRLVLKSLFANGIPVVLRNWQKAIVVSSNCQPSLENSKSFVLCRLSQELFLRLYVLNVLVNARKCPHSVY